MHPLTLREDIVSLQYALLSSESEQADSTCDNPVQELLRLSLLMYLVTILNELPAGLSICDMLGGRVQSSLQNIQLHNELTSEFRLWIIFTGASIVGSSPIKGYFLTSAIEVIRKLGLSKWEEAKEAFRSFFWVEKIHEAAFRPLWDSIIRPQ